MCVHKRTNIITECKDHNLFIYLSIHFSCVAGICSRSYYLLVLCCFLMPNNDQMYRVLEIAYMILLLL